MLSIPIITYTMTTGTSSLSSDQALGSGTHPLAYLNGHGNIILPE